ncbi:MAG: anti-sigma factor [Burkholderiales bacterium]|nr:anti-sigma factor [Burkholderiales bacterium]
MEFNDTDIHRLIDGQLAPEAQKAVSAWVEADPARRAQAAAWRRQRELLRARFDPLLVEAVPPRLLMAAKIGRAANNGRLRRVSGLTALAAACLAAGWFGHALVSSRAPVDILATLPARAAVAHRVYLPEVRHFAEVAAHEEHLIRWLSRRLATKVSAPTLLEHGFRLVGGRLLPGEDRPMAQFLYQNDAGKRLTLYVVALAAPNATRESAFRFEQRGEVGVFVWSEDGRGYALSGSLTREEMMPVARAVYDALNLAAKEPAKGPVIEPAKSPAVEPPRVPAADPRKNG